VIAPHGDCERRRFEQLSLICCIVIAFKVGGGFSDGGNAHGTQEISFPEDCQSCWQDSEQLNCEQSFSVCCWADTG